MLLTDSGLDATLEVLTGEKLVQVTGHFGKSKWMILSTDAAPEIPQKTIVIMCPSGFILNCQTLQSLGAEELPEHILKQIDAASKPLQNLFHGLRATVRTASFEHPSFDPFFGLDRR